MVNNCVHAQLLLLPPPKKKQLNNSLICLPSKTVWLYTCRNISYKHFKTLLKTYMFDYRPRRFVTFYISALEILLYLLTYILMPLRVRMPMKVKQQCMHADLGCLVLSRL